MQASPSEQSAVLARFWQPRALSQLSVVQTLLSLQLGGAPPTQPPPEHKSPVVQALLSVHDPVLLTKLQPVALLQLSVVQGLLSSHGRLPVGLHEPPLHLSPVVHASLSVQLAVFATLPHLPALQASSVQTLPSLQSPALAQLPPQPMIGLKMHEPPAGSQLSVVQLSLSLQSWGVPGVQAPLLQLSLAVHLLPSSHGLVLASNLQPTAAAQLSVVQALLSLQTGAAPPTQLPPAQVSEVVHKLLSLQGELLLTSLQPVAGSQLSDVHSLPSSQLTAMGAVQPPPLQMSPLVQALLSLQIALLLALLQAPVAMLQLSVVHGLPSEHVFLAPDAHLPAAQTSGAVHASLSEHPLVLLTELQTPLLALQLSLVQGLASSQTLAAPDLHTPASQASFKVQRLLSLQPKILFGNAHLPLTHLSSVQPLPSLQSLAVLQLPPQPILGANTQLPSPGLQLSSVQS